MAKASADLGLSTFFLPAEFTPHFDEWHATHKPTPVAANWDEIKQFGKVGRDAFPLPPLPYYTAMLTGLSPSQDVHDNVVKKLLVIFAIVLELKDENYFVEVSLRSPFEAWPSELHAELALLLPASFPCALATPIRREERGS